MSKSENPVDRDRLLSRVLGPEAAEVSCEQCFEQLDRYVELSIADRDAADRRLPGMREHLDGCPACSEEYRSLREFIDG
jgi:hypothetical protein